MRTRCSRSHRWWRLSQRQATLLAVLAFTLIPISAFAAEILTEETIVVSAPIDDDLYLFGADIVVNAHVSGDVTAFGARVRIHGDVAGSVFVTSSEVYIHGDVGGSVVVAARSVTVTGNVGHAVRVVASDLDVHGSRISGDLVAAASTVDVDEQSPIGGDVRLRAGDTELLGGVVGDVRGSTDDLSIGGTVGGTIDARVDRLRFTSTAVVDAPFRYTSDQEYLIHRDARVSGAATRLTPERPSVEERIGRTVVFIVFRFAWAFALGLFLLRVAPDFLRQTANTLMTRPGRSVGFGMLALIAAPLTIVFLMITVIGLPVALVLLGVFLLALYASQIVVGLAVGNAITKRSWQPAADSVSKLALGIGLGIVVTLRSLPIPNLYGFVSIVTVILALGALALTITWRRVVDVDDLG